MALGEVAGRVDPQHAGGGSAVHCAGERAGAVERAAEHRVGMAHDGNAIRGDPLHRLQELGVGVVVHKHKVCARRNVVQDLGHTGAVFGGYTEGVAAGEAIGGVE